MDIKDTTKGEIYTCVNGQGELFIYTCGKSGEQIFNQFICSSLTKKEFRSAPNGSCYSWSNLRESTPQEIHWLKECIKVGKGIYFEDAMKTFNGEPQYEIY